MARSQARRSKSESLSAEKLVSRARRRSWTRDLVWFHIDELNGLFDTVQPGEDGEISPNRIEVARLRVQRLTLAAGWSEGVYREQAWRFIAEGLERPEDAFGAAVILLALAWSTQAPGRTRWLQELPASVLRSLDVVGALPSVALPDSAVLVLDPDQLGRPK